MFSPGLPGGVGGGEPPPRSYWFEVYPFIVFCYLFYYFYVFTNLCVLLFFSFLFVVVVIYCFFVSVFISFITIYVLIFRFKVVLLFGTLP